MLRVLRKTFHSLLQTRGGAHFACPGFSHFAEAQGNGDFINPEVQGGSLSHFIVSVKLRGAYLLSLLTKP